MSYWTTMEMDTGGEEIATVCEMGNMTSNVSRMWTKALGHTLASMHGWQGHECIPHLNRAIKSMTEPALASDYLALNPPNGWGDVAGARAYLLGILLGCRAHPNASLRVSH